MRRRCCCKEGCDILALFTYDDASPPNYAIDFTDTSTSSCNITVWNWDFGDGNTSTSQNPSHTYDSAGFYNVTLYVEDDCGCYDEKVVEIEVLQPACDLVADFRWVLNPPPATRVDFTDMSTSSAAITGWNWDFGDGVGTSTEQNPFYVYPSAGEYLVVLVVTDALGCEHRVEKLITLLEGHPECAYIPARWVANLSGNLERPNGSLFECDFFRDPDPDRIITPCEDQQNDFISIWDFSQADGIYELPFISNPIFAEYEWAIQGLVHILHDCRGNVTTFTEGWLFIRVDTNCPFLIGPSTFTITATFTGETPGISDEFCQWRKEITLAPGETIFDKGSITLPILETIIGNNDFPTSSWPACQYDIESARQEDAFNRCRIPNNGLPYIDGPSLTITPGLPL